MKIGKIVVLIFILSLNINPKKVYGEEIKYYRVLNTSSYLYEDSSLMGEIFIIPYSYYVKIEEEHETYYKVSYGDYLNNYPQIIGYMKKNDLTITKNLPITPFFISKVSTKNADILFNDSKKEKPYFNVSKDSLLIFYGEYIDKNNEVLAYCYYNNKLGYISKSSLYNYTIPLNQDPIIENNPPNNSENDNLEKDENKATFLINENLQIIIIVGISIICISVVYALFKPTKNKVSKNSEVFDEAE